MNAATINNMSALDIESVCEKLNEIGNAQVEYETAHNAGDSYAYLVSESWSSDTEKRLIDYMKEKAIDCNGINIDALSDSVLDQFKMQSGHMWSMGNGDCLLECFPIGEIEVQIDAESLGLGEITQDVCDALSRHSDFYVRRQDAETLLAYQTSDCVWEACISEKALRDIVSQLRNQD